MQIAWFFFSHVLVLWGLMLIGYWCGYKAATSDARAARQSAAEKNGGGGGSLGGFTPSKQYDEHGNLVAISDADGVVTFVATGQQVKIISGGGGGGP